MTRKTRYSRGQTLEREERQKKHLAEVLPKRKLWERRDDLGDTAESWHYFATYRDLKCRTIERARYGLDDRATRPGGLMPSLLQMRTWHDQNHWAERVEAYDAHMESILQEEKELTIRRTAEDHTTRHLQLLSDVTEGAETMARKVAAHQQATEEVPKVSDLVKIVDAAVKLGRMVTGETTDNVQVKLDMEGLTVEQLEAIAGFTHK